MVRTHLTPGLVRQVQRVRDTRIFWWGGSYPRPSFVVYLRATPTESADRMTDQGPPCTGGVGVSRVLPVAASTVEHTLLYQANNLADAYENVLWEEEKLQIAERIDRARVVRVATAVQVLTGAELYDTMYPHDPHGTLPRDPHLHPTFARDRLQAVQRRQEESAQAVETQRELCRLAGAWHQRCRMERDRSLHYYEPYLSRRRAERAAETAIATPPLEPLVEYTLVRQDFDLREAKSGVEWGRRRLNLAREEDRVRGAEVQDALLGQGPDLRPPHGGPLADPFFLATLVREAEARREVTRRAVAEHEGQYQEARKKCARCRAALEATQRANGLRREPVGHPDEDGPGGELVQM